VNNPLLECECPSLFQPIFVSYKCISAEFYTAAGICCMDSRHDLPQAMQLCQKALNVSKICGDINLQCNALIDIACIKSNAGEYCTAQVYATEAQRLSKLSAILFQEVKALQVGAMCLGLDTGRPAGPRAPTCTQTRNSSTWYGWGQNPCGSTHRWKPTCGFGNPCTGPLLFERWNCVLERKKSVWMGDKTSVKVCIHLYENVVEVKPNIAANL
jgi:hypothetical protein